MVATFESSPAGVEIGRGGGPAALAACIRAEFLKMRRAPVWLAFVLLPAASAGIGIANYAGNLKSAGGVLTPGWENLWTQQTLFICYFFLPALVGVAASYLWRLEHQGSNWDELMCAPVPAWCIAAAKLAVCALFMLAAFASILVFYVASGLALGVPGDFPAVTIAENLALGWIGSLAICGIQLAVSMLVRNFAAPVGVALAGGVLGLAAAMGGFQYVFPYSLLQAGMSSNALAVVNAGTAFQIVFVSVLWTALALSFAIVWLCKTDIHAD